MSALPIDQALALALQHHQAGRLPEAEAIYRQILATHPNHFDALHLLGVIAHQTGHNDSALQLIQRALAINPNAAAAYENLGKVLTDQDKFGEAIAAYRQAIRLRPLEPSAHYNLSVVYQKKGDVENAIASSREAIRLKPNHSEAHCNLGYALTQRDQLDDAITAFRNAIESKPDYAEAYGNLGNALIRERNLPQAVEAFEKAVAINPHLAESHFNLADAYHDQKRFEEAIAEYKAAIRLNPGQIAFHLNFGEALRRVGRPDDAIAACRAALALDPHSVKAYIKIGRAHEERGDLDSAIATYRTAIDVNPNSGDPFLHLAYAMALKGDVEACSRALDAVIAAYRADVNANPTSAESHFKLAIMLLSKGDLIPGWREYEWRSRVKEHRYGDPEFAKPQWTGEDLAGRTIFLYFEQGLGDTLQFIRYLPMVSQRGGKAVVLCPPPLLRLLQVSFPANQFIAPGGPPPAFDVRCPLGSLPLTFETSLQTIPNQVPYLRANQATSARWKERLADYASSLKVGLCWAGNRDFKYDHFRSPRRLELFAPLAQVKNASFFSLQKGEAAAQTAHPPAGLNVIDWTADLHDFADTAALLANLDLIITSDTALAHLAGAMGKPTWLLLHTTPDWRWMLNRSDNPWYPTMRLFRQSGIGKWPDVIDRVVEALQANAIHPANAKRVEL